MDILQDFEWRGLIFQSTDRDALNKRLNDGPITLYCGFDPTADSLHIGSLLPILALRRFQLAGHNPIGLVGGGTGLIGDPSGKANERTLNTVETVQGFADKLREQLSRFLDFENEKNPAQIANNYDWLGSFQVIEFLRDIGKNFSLNYMLAKESVNSRLEKGISFTEFSYMILQAYDFLKLNETRGCELQIGGSDQWGNITAGTELIRRTSTEDKSVFGLTMPLVTKSDGTKFGKTESGTIWLDADKTSPYKFYQFWLNTDDRDVVQFLKYFTFLSHEEIESLASKVQSEPEKREAQRALAREVTTLVHGAEAMERAVEVSAALFSGDLKSLSGREVEECFADVPSTTLETSDMLLIDLLIETGAAKSKREAREYISGGAVSINGEKYTDLEANVANIERLGGQFLVVRRGKKNYYLVKFAG